MENSELSEEQIQEILQRRYSDLKWSKLEFLFRNRSLLRNQKLIGQTIPTFRAFLHKLRKSAFGAFVDHFNESHEQSKFVNENKFGILQCNIRQFSEADKVIFERRNDLFDDTLEQLEEYVKYQDCICIERIYNDIKCLRILDCNATKFDDGFLKLKNLQVLVLTGNWIEDIEGSCLPRQLRYLELFANKISSIDNLVENPPKDLVHIGLGRNNLADDSNLHLLCRRKFPKLLSLDISDNDICELHLLVDSLIQLQSMIMLQTEGNPCYVDPSYKHIIIRNFPNLQYLDYTEILEEDRLDSQQELVHTIPELVFKCFRIIGLPQPPKEKNVKQTFHMEVTIPLLEEFALEPESEPEEESETKNEEKKEGKKGKKGDKKESKDSKGKKSKSSKSEKSKGSKGSKKSKKGRKGKKEKKGNPYTEKENEYDEKLEKKIKGRFFTERKPWSKMLELPELHVQPPRADKTLLRDTLRTNVEIKLIYLKFLPPAKKEKGKKKGKGKNRDKKKKGKGIKKGGKKNKSSEKGEGDKKGGSKGSKISESDAPTTENVPEEPKETILKKITIAHFNCDLYNVNWSEETNDFYWAEHKDLTATAIPVIGSLKALTYSNSKRKGMKRKDKKKKKEKKKDKKSKKGKKDKTTTETETTAETTMIEIPTSGPQPFPREFTCQVGFGVTRHNLSS